MKGIAFSMLLMISLAELLFVAPVKAATVEELNNRILEKQKTIEQIESEIKVYQKELDTTQSAKQSLTKEISSVNTQLKHIDADIRLNAKLIEKAELTIESLNYGIDEQEARLVLERKAIAELLRTLRESEDQSVVEIMLSHDKISDYFDNVESISVLDNALKDNMQSLRELKASLVEKKESTESETIQLKLLHRDLDAKKQIQQQFRASKNSLLSNTKQNEAKYQQLVSTRENTRREILSEINSIEDELRKLIDTSTLPTKRTGVLTWPIEHPVVTQGYGYTDFAQQATDVYKGGGHNGIDFRARVGTPILATDDGIILDTGDTDRTCPGGSYGKWIVIKHENNLATLYAHLSLIEVSNGESVHRGDRIGYSGNTGFTTGPHLHFTVYDARTIKFGPSKSGRCSYLPYGGYLNPLEYL